MKFLISSSILIFLGYCKKSNTTHLQEFKNASSVSDKVMNNLDEFNFFISVLEKDQNNRPSSFKIEIIKNSKNFQNITYNPSAWPVIKDSLALTRANYFANDTIINDGVEHFHDFIIADFNFDGLEDFAILYDFGGNGGPSYSYFFQNEKGEFLSNKEFPLNEGPFPKIINKADKTLVIKRPKGCCKTNTTVFQLQKNNWKIISTTDEAME
ncbi:XAC2610-related protein [Chryseobacterium indologenes]|uniref:XAC2610-related protein n=1 Tax=Chryseobacterium indologenes TaxID=253 RepID=UPI000764A846|nr:hypothetical protein [Chryseobacterium indologenes]AYY83502.1 hypothetical protein EGX91_02455 [Chryseobacterium indologenes]QIX80415.1 hypothetical protein FOB56_03845 [Chryseobacterium indologenes]UDQ54069.1 hypothetical protein LJF28_22125 [Chryseobacterium indologenes]